MTGSSPEPPKEEQSSLRMDPNLVGALSYAFGCISGILIYLLETESDRVKFHALQSILVFALLTILSCLSVVLAIFTDFVPFRITSSLIWILQFVLWLVLIVRTYQGYTIKIPGIGDFAQRQVGWPQDQDESVG